MSISRPATWRAGDDGQSPDDVPLRVAEGLDLVFIGDNEVLIQFGTRSRPSELLRDTGLTGVLRCVLYPLSRGQHRRAELLAPLTDDARVEANEILDGLIEKGIVTRAADSTIDQYLSFTFGGERRLGQARVAVIGAGPLGARIASSLIQHGLAVVALLDERRTDDVWRSMLPLGSSRTPESVPSAEALRGVLNGSGRSDVRVIDGGFAPAGVVAATADVDLAILATEQPHPRLAHLVNRACLREQRAWLAAGLDGNLGLVGPLFLPPDTACYNDYETLTRSTSPNPQMDAAYHRFLRGRSGASFFAGSPAYADVVAGMAAVAAIQFLLRGACFALGRLTTFDFESMQIDVDDVLRLPRCPVCAGATPTEPIVPPRVRSDLGG